MGTRRRKEIPVFDSEDVAVGWTGSTGPSKIPGLPKGGKGSHGRRSRRNATTSRRPYLLHFPTSIRVECEPVPPGNYTRKTMRRLTAETAAKAMPELERRVLEHYRALRRKGDPDGR